MATTHTLDFTLEVKELAARLTNLTLAQAAELRICLEEVHGIHPAAVPVAAREETETLPPPIPEPTLFSVVLSGLAVADKKINVFKAVSEVAGLGLKETRELVEGAPSVVKADVSKDEAAALKKKLEDAGARITLVPR
jgi:large subunit ribosomal protein L7/L12